MLIMRTRAVHGTSRAPTAGQWWVRSISPSFTGLVRRRSSQDVIGDDQLDHARCLRCPEVLPPNTDGVLVLGDQLVEQFQDPGVRPCVSTTSLWWWLVWARNASTCISVRCAARARQ